MGAISLKGSYARRALGIKSDIPNALGGAARRGGRGRSSTHLSSAAALLVGHGTPAYPQMPYPEYWHHLQSERLPHGPFVSMSRQSADGGGAGGEGPGGTGDGGVGGAGPGGVGGDGPEPDATAAIGDCWRPHCFEPYSRRMYPASPHELPQEFFTIQ